MKRTSLSILLFLLPATSSAQTGLSADVLLSRSIEYHDPSGRWQTFARTLVLQESRPSGEERTVLVSIDKPNERFVYDRKDDGTHIRGVLEQGTCTATLNGSAMMDDDDRERYGLACAMIERRRNYYQYLYGLPMKLRDRGTIIAPAVSRTRFMDRDVLMINVSYEESVGSDVWRFYFDPQSFRLVGYRFYHDEAKNDGEYVTLEGEYLLDDMRIPKVRKWYRNSDDRYVGTDVLESHQRVGYVW